MYRILVKEVWDRPDAAELNTCWIEKFATLKAAQRRVNKIKNTDKWDCVGDWKLVAFAGQPWELYDLARDRVEMNNLASSEPERVARPQHRLPGPWSLGIEPDGVGRHAGLRCGTVKRPGACAFTQTIGAAGVSGQKGFVGAPLLEEVPVNGEGNRQIGAGPDGQMDVGLLGEWRQAGIDDDEPFSFTPEEMAVAPGDTAGLGQLEDNDVRAALRREKPKSIGMWSITMWKKSGTTAQWVGQLG